MKDRATPSSFNGTINRPVSLTADDLDNHPLAETYIIYLNNSRFPVDFKSWLSKREKREMDTKQRERAYIAALASDPYCRTPLKMRRYKRRDV